MRNLRFDNKNPYHTDGRWKKGPWVSSAWDLSKGNVWIPLETDIVPVIGRDVLGVGSHIRNSNITRTNPWSGLVETLDNNIPVHELVGGHLALRDEPEGTNLIQYSHELGNVASAGWWNETALTSVTADGMLAPDGNIVADGLIADVNDRTHNVYTAVIVGIGTNDKVALTAFVKPGNKDWVFLRLTFRNAADVGLGDESGYYFNVSTGAIGSKIELGDGTVHDYLMESAANGFYRIGVIVSSSDANVAKVDGRLFSAHADNDNDFPGDTVTVNTWFWGADLKKQDFFSSYVPTSGATATRATESGYPRYAIPIGLFNAQGTLIIWMYHGMVFGDYSAGDYGIVSLNGNAKSALYLDENGNVCTFDGTNETVHNVNWPINVWRKYVLTWDQATNAVQVGVDTGAGVALTAGIFDGAYDVAGGILSLSQGLLAPRHLRNFMIDDEVWSVPKIDSFGSP